MLNNIDPSVLNAHISDLAHRWYIDKAIWLTYLPRITSTLCNVLRFFRKIPSPASSFSSFFLGVDVLSLFQVQLLENNTTILSLGRVLWRAWHWSLDVCPYQMYYLWTPGWRDEFWEQTLTVLCKERKGDNCVQTNDSWWDLSFLVQRHRTGMKRATSEYHLRVQNS